MFSVSIKSEKPLEEQSLKTSNNIVRHLKDELNKKSLTIIKEDNVINITSGNLDPINKGIIAEISFKYQVSISNDDINKREDLDKFIFYIKSCLDNLSAIEDNKYIPLEYRRDKT